MISHKQFVHRRHVLIAVFTLFLITACVYAPIDDLSSTKNKSTLTTPTCTIPLSTTTTLTNPTTNTFQETSIKVPPEPTYPMPFEKQLVYYANKKEVQEIITNKPGKFGDYQVFINYPSNLYDKDMQKYIKLWIDDKVDEKRNEGFPKYPGILRKLADLTLSECKIRVYVHDTINNIMQINIHRYLEFSNGQQLDDTDTYYLDILTGQQISINHIMNSEQGIAELNQMIMHSYDVFVAAEDVEETNLYEMPFRQAFQGLPDAFNINLRRNVLSIELNEHCLDCHFYESNYDLVVTPTMFNIKGFTNTLYDRHYQPDMKANATPGQLMFNQVWDYDMYAKRIEVNEKNQLVSIQTYEKDVAPYLIEKSNELLKELRPIIADAEKQFGFRLADVASDSYITVRIVHGSLLDTVNLDYNIQVHANVYVKGSLSRNYHPITHKEIILKDLFVSDYQYRQMIKDKFTWFLKVSQSSVSIDTVMAQLEQIDFEFQDDKFILHSYPYQGDKRKVLQSLKVEFSIDELSLDIFRPFWK